ncbi:NAD(P)-dependent oxidoreductase, partial [Martelella mediterranea]
TFDLPETLAGAEPQNTIAEAVSGCELVMVCLTGPDAQKAVYFGDDGIVANIAAGTIIADATTTDPDLSRSISASIAERNASYLDTPVFGSKGEAWAGKLDFVCGGDQSALERLGPVLKPLSATVHYMGPTGSGAMMKLVGNLLVAAQMESLGEALALARKAGLDGDAVMGVFDVTDYSSLLIRNVGRATLAGDYSPSFYLRHMLKDTRLVRAFAGSQDVPVPVTTLIGELYASANNKGLGDLNASAIHKMLFELSGL